LHIEQLGTNRPVEAFEYDALRQMVAHTDPLARVTAFEYDPLGRRTDYGYDPLHRTTSVTLPDPAQLGGSGGPVTEYGYDFSGNLLNITQEATADHDAPETTYRYDLAGQQVGMSDPVGRDTA